MALDHANLSDVKKHTPKNFTPSSNGASSWKNEIGVNQYFPTGKLPDCINVVNALSAPPTEVSGAIYILTDQTLVIGRQQIDSLLWQSGTTIRATFNAGYNLIAEIGDYLFIQNSGVSIQNGRYVITGKGTGTIDFTNTDITSNAADESASPSYASFGKSNWDGGTSGDWVKFDGTNWQPVLIGNGSSVYNLNDNILYYYYKSLIVADLNVKRYRANITQVTTGAPTSVIIAPNEIGSLSWSRISAGTYGGLLTGAFANASEFWAVISGLSVGNTAIIRRSSANSVIIETYDSTGTLADGLLTDTSIEIIVKR